MTWWKFRNCLSWSISPTAEDLWCSATLRETGIQIKVKSEGLSVVVVVTTIEAKMLMPVRSMRDSFDDAVSLPSSVVREIWV